MPNTTGRVTTRHKGNLGLAHAMAYFARHNYYIFLPVGDNGGAIDLIVSLDGIHVQRVQVKYTTARHDALRLATSTYFIRTGHYGLDSFDLLYVYP